MNNRLYCWGDHSLTHAPRFIRQEETEGGGVIVYRWVPEPGSMNVRVFAEKYGPDGEFLGKDDLFLLNPWTETCTELVR